MNLQALSFPSNCRRMLALALAVIVFLPTLTLTVSANSPANLTTNYEHFVIYRGEDGNTVCRDATLAEARELDKIKPTGLKPINHLTESPKSRLGAENLPSHLTIILEATDALNANAPAKAAFQRAAAQWESRINSPVTIYIEVDYGPTNFGTAWPQGVLGSTSSPSLTSVNYNTVRNALIAGADTPAKQAVFNALPANSVPTDNGTGSSSFVSVSGSIARAIGLLNSTAPPTDPKARIGFNSQIVTYDFDPSNGTTGTDFESVAMHEIGHALGFSSRSGSNSTVPAIWDLYRFRSGTTSSTFTTAQRIMTVGGPTTNSQYYFAPGNTEVGLSDGGPNPPNDPPFPNNSDGNQSSHWRQQSLNGGAYIGIMDPRMPGGIIRAITDRDLTAIGLFGYSSNVAAPPPNDNFASAQFITGCSGSVSGTNVGATSESGETNHLSSTSDNDGGGRRSVWYRWLAPSNSSVTITTLGSTFDTVLGVYTGGTVDSTAVIGQHDDIGGSDTATNKTSSVTFNAAAGTMYMIAVDGYDNGGAGGDTGSIALNWSVTNCTAALQLLQDLTGPAADQASAVDSVFLVRDPFLVVNSANVFNSPSDPNTRVMIFQKGLLNVPASSITVNLIDSNSLSYDIAAQDIRLVPSQDFTQIIFRLPSNLPAGTCRIKVSFQGLFSNTVTFRIRT
jgi:hypothetical protein